MKNYMIILFLLPILFLVSCGTPTGQSIQPTCREVEKEIPIEVEYQDVEDYQTELEYELVGEPSTQGKLGFNFKLNGIITVKNTDDETGEFKVQQTINRLKFDPITLSTTKKIKAGETLQFIQTFDVGITDDIIHTYKITPQSVVKSRTVTKTRTEIVKVNTTVCE